MQKRRWRLTGRWWMLLPIALLALALPTDGPAAAARFPEFVPMPGVTPRGVAVDKVGNVSSVPVKSARMASTS